MCSAWCSSLSVWLFCCVSPSATSRLRFTSFISVTVVSASDNLAASLAIIEVIAFGFVFLDLLDVFGGEVLLSFL